MASITSDNLIALFARLAQKLEAEQGYLCALDGHIGDADHGVAMAEGFAAVAKAQAGLDAATASPTDVFNTAAKSFLNAVGASSGPLYATAFMRAGALVKGKAELAAADVPGLIEAMSDGIRQRGKAEAGEKTMVDAWLPAADAVAAARSTGRTPVEMLAAARMAAEAGRDATKDMIATKGRSARLGERARGHVDPGAASAAMIIAVMTEILAGHLAE